MEVFFGGSSGPGKSSALLAAALQYVDVSNYNAIIIRDKFTNLNKPNSLIPRSHEWLFGTDAVWNSEKHTWRFPSGATLSFGYLDGPNDHLNYQGPEYQFVGLDEVVAIREYQAMYLFSRMRNLLKYDYVPMRFRCASNPPTREQMETGAWVKRRYIDEKTREPGAVYIPAKLEDNPYINKEQYLESLNKLDPVTRKQLIEGDWNIKSKGLMFESTWFKIVEIPPTDIIKSVRYWDFAATEKRDDNNPCWTSGCKMGKTKDGKYIIEDIKRFRGVPGKVEQTVRQTAQLDGINTSIYIEQEPGSGGKIVIDHYIRNVLAGYSIHGDKVTGNKSDRANPFSCQAEAGNVYMVAGRWNKEFLDEVELFPDSEFKDQVDSTSGAFNKLAFGGRASACIV